MQDGIVNAIITSAELDDADRGFLNAWVHLDYGGSGQGFGGYALYMPRDFKSHDPAGPNYAGHFIWRVMEVAGVTKWSALRGKTVRVQIDDGLVKGIGHIVKEDWFVPSVDFKVMEAEHTALKAWAAKSKEGGAS